MTRPPTTADTTMETNLLNDTGIYFLLEKAKDPVELIILSLFLKTGITLHELANLTAGDIDVIGKTITIPPMRGKGFRLKGKVRTVRMPDDLAHSILDHQIRHRLTGKDRILFSRETDRMSERRIQQIVSQATASATGKRMSPRDMRTSYIINELKRGTPVKDIEKATGLASIGPYAYRYIASRQP